MLVIGHRGAAGEKPENTLASLKAAKQSGAPMVQINVRLTLDKKLVLIHDDTLERTHNMPVLVRRCTLKELQKRTGGMPNPICTLEEALLELLPHVVTMIHATDKGSGVKILELLAKAKLKPYADNALISSFSSRELSRIRNLNKKIKLALIVKFNPFTFLAWERKLGLTAVGFHRLHLNKIAIDAARKLDIFSFVYTVNRLNALNNLQKQHIDAVATDYPTKFMAHLSKK